MNYTPVIQFVQLPPNPIRGQAFSGPDGVVYQFSGQVWTRIEYPPPPVEGD